MKISSARDDLLAILNNKAKDLRCANLNFLASLIPDRGMAEDILTIDRFNSAFFLANDLHMT